MATLQAKDISTFLAIQSHKPTLRFITCGSVDDGKSTLIGRLLFESKAIFDDQLASLEKDSRQYGTQGERLDLALLVDGLLAEREQGITIDVAYRFFASDKRRFIVADTPGHEQYTRNMATGASSAQLAVILIDARKGVLVQTCRHSRIVAMMGIRHAVLAVNKMDLIDYSQDMFNSIVADYQQFANGLGFNSVQAIPLSGLEGDNVLQASGKMPWYSGPSLMTYLDSIDVIQKSELQAFRMPVQWVNRPHLDFRGFCGTVAKGYVKSGDRVRVLPSGVQTSINKVISGFNEVANAADGEAITVTLVDEVDVSRGDVLVAADQPAEVADQFQAHLLWMHEHALTPGRQYLLKLAT
jgi:bifunctional enzyme CysN/CysC